MASVTAKKITCFSRMMDASSRVCIVSHIHPDGDAVGSVAAMWSYLSEKRGKEAVTILPHCPQAQLEFISRRCPLVTDEESHDSAVSAIKACDLLICLDFNDFSRAGELEGCLREFPGPKVLVDHHLNPSEEDFDLCFSKTDTSSASEFLFEILMSMEDICQDASALPSLCAEALMTGMTTDTNNFANSVFPSTLRMASALLASGVDRDSILCHLFNEYRENRVRAMSSLLGGMKITEDGVAYMILTGAEKASLDLQEGETEGFVNIPLSIDRVKMSVFIREDDGFFRVSVRSKKGTSANRFARQYFHGGGHEQAAGGRLLIPEDIPEAGGSTQYIENASARFMKESALGI